MSSLHGNKLTDFSLRVISIDPGSNRAGYTVIDYNLTSGKKNVLYSNTMSGDALSGLYFEPYAKELYGERMTKNMSHGLFLGHLLKKYKPMLVVCEAAYAGKFINAYKALTEHVTLLRVAVYNYDRTLEFGMIEPSRVKALMGVKGNTGDKTLMTKALKKREDVLLNEIDISSLDEHSIDSICIGITACNIVKDNFDNKEQPKKKKKSKASRSKKAKLKKRRQ